MLPAPMAQKYQQNPLHKFASELNIALGLNFPLFQKRSKSLETIWQHKS
jgi:hypothetical protein